jgi:hypothetical protein
MERVVTRREVIVRAGATCVLVGVGVVLALAGSDVLAWRGQTQTAETAVERYSSDPRVWKPSTVLPAGVSKWLLGTGDDVTFGRALQRFQRLRRNGEQSLSANNGIELANVELTLDEIVHSHDRAEVRGRAQQLHAILLFHQLLLQGIDAKTALERSIADFQQAVRIDPSNATAKYDLEALLYVYRPIAQGEAVPLVRHKSNRGQDSGGGGSPGATQQAGGF